MSTTDTIEATGQGLVEFLQRLGRQGKLKANTSGAYASASEKVLEIDEGWQTLDLRSLDAEEQLDRFVNLRHASYTPASLTTYKTRFTRSLEMYLAYLEDPSGWRPPRSEKPARAKREKGESLPEVVTSETEEEKSTHRGQQPPKDLDRFAFNLRPGLLAYVEVPADMTKAEAKRLQAFVEALAVDPQLALPTGDDMS